MQPSISPVCDVDGHFCLSLLEIVENTKKTAEAAILQGHVRVITLAWPLFCRWSVCETFRA
ncbi:MAG: hypothetical protein JWN70_3236 [Planctomycetaceae bacterium]|nr:hypothetical protein [Planctomycetaceae bacterium]